MAQTFLLIHGAWHGAWCWWKVQAGLEAKGHRVKVIDLPGLGIDSTPPNQVTLDDYAARIEQALDGLQRVVLVGHSMGGIAISAGAERQPKPIAKLVYLSAFLLPSGRSLLDVAQADTESLATPNLIPNPERGFVDVNRAEVKNIFYGQCSTAEVALAQSLLKVSPLAPFATPLVLTDQRYGKIDRFYIKGLRDRAITPKAQQQMLEDMPCKKVFELDTDHSPFMSRAEETVVLLDQIARG